MRINPHVRSRLARLLRKPRYRFALPAIAAFALVWCATLFVPRSYEATARFHRGGGTIPTQADDAPASLTRRPIEQDVKDRAILDAVAAETHTTADALDRSITVEALPADDVAVRVRNRNPQTAADLANRLAETYLDAAKKARAAQLADAQAFFTKQIEARQDELAMLRLDKNRLEQENPTLADSSADATREAQIAANAELRAVEQQMAQLEQERVTLTKFISEQPDELEQRTRGRNPEVAQLNSQKAQLEEELNEHRYKWGRTDDHPLVKKTLAKLAEIEGKLAATPPIIDLVAQRQTNPAKLESKAKLESLTALERSLTARRDTLRQQVDELSSQRGVNFLGRDEYAATLRKIDAAQQDTDFWLNKQRNLSLTQTAGIAGPAGELVFTQRAVPPTRASFPAPGLPTLVALLCGVAAGLVTLWATRVTDGGFDSIEAAQRELELTVLGVVDEMADEPVVMPRRMAA